MVEHDTTGKSRGNGFGCTPLHVACAYASNPPRAPLVEWILGHPDGEATLNSFDGSGYTPLHNAAEYGGIPVIELLLQHGADPTLENCMNGTTPAQRAREGDHLQAAKILEEAARAYTTSKSSCMCLQSARLRPHSGRTSSRRVGLIPRTKLEDVDDTLQKAVNLAFELDGDEADFGDSHQRVRVLCGCGMSKVPPEC